MTPDHAGCGRAGRTQHLGWLPLRIEDRRVARSDTDRSGSVPRGPSRAATRSAVIVDHRSGPCDRLDRFTGAWSRDLDQVPCEDSSTPRMRIAPPRHAVGLHGSAWRCPARARRVVQRVELLQGIGCSCGGGSDVRSRRAERQREQPPGRRVHARKQPSGARWGSRSRRGSSVPAPFGVVLAGAWRGSALLVPRPPLGPARGSVMASPVRGRIEWSDRVHSRCASSPGRRGHLSPRPPRPSARVSRDLVQ